MEKEDIIIRTAIVHILDSTIGIPVLSDTLLNLGPDLNDFLRTHIYKIASSDDIKNCNFNEDESFVYECLQNFSEDHLIEVSQKLATYLYTIMNQNIDILPADLLVVTYQMNSEIYLALLKMNYKSSYIHLTGQDLYGNNNDIVKQKATLPSETSKLNEAVLIKLSDYSISIIERKYEINGVKTNYLSKLFLQCKTNMSPKAKLNIVKKAVDQINQKYYENDFDKQMEVKSILHNEYMEQGAIHIESITDKIYKNNDEIKAEFTEKLEKYNLTSEEVKPQNKQTVRKLEKQYLTTDTGIEINVPMEQYNNTKNIEFITNPDGTISVLIKNISHITSK